MSKKFVIPINYFNFTWWAEKIKNIFQTKKVLVENFFSLSFLQIANYIFPLITLPYLVRILKPEKYGLIAFANAFIGYFTVLADYGFNLSAPREISIYRDDKQKLSEIFSSVMVIKFFLFLVSFCVMSIIIFLFDKFRRDWLLYYLTFGMVLGHIMFPTWFFQGIEKMKFITILNLLAKLIFTISIFIFIKKLSDYYLVPILNSLGYLVAGVVSIYIIFNNFKINFIVPKKIQIFYQLKEGWYIFNSTLAVSLYTNFNTLFLGLLTNNLVVGYYSAADKIVRSVVQLTLWPLAQTIYPRISIMMKENRDIAIKFIKKILKLGTLFYFSLSVILFIFSKEIVNLILGKDFINSVAVMRIISILPFFIFLNNIFGMQTMLNLNFKKEFSRVFVFACLINLLLLFVLVRSYQHIGAAICNVIVELIIPLTMFIILVRKRIKII